MEIVDLYDHLKAAYTPENMNLISGRIIHMFREHQYDRLRAIQKVVNEYTPCAEEKINKVFSRLIMFYHPDRLSQNLGPNQLLLSSIITDEDLAEEFGWYGRSAE